MRAAFRRRARALIRRAIIPSTTSDFPPSSCCSLRCRQNCGKNPLHPYDFRALAAEFEGTLAHYGEAAGDNADFGPVHCSLAGLQEALSELYSAAASLTDRAVADADVRAFNDAQLALARELVPINFTRKGRFRTEPAVPIPELPDLAAALTVSETSGHLRNVTRTHLMRGVNRVAWCFEQAAAIARRAAADING